jgi:hypothetical protein
VDEKIVAQASRLCVSETELAASGTHRQDACATTETLREQIRRRELSAIVPMQTLEASARLLVKQGVTNETEFKRVFGL